MAGQVSDRDFLGSGVLDKWEDSADGFASRNSPQGFRTFSRRAFLRRRQDLRRAPQPLHTATILRDVRRKPFWRSSWPLWRRLIQFDGDRKSESGPQRSVVVVTNPSSRPWPWTPLSQDIWAAVGRVLVHFDKNGSYLGEYFIATPEGAPLRVSAMIVEPDRLIVASDSRGIYEFTRFDRNASRSSVRGTIVPAPGPQQNPTPQ